MKIGDIIRKALAEGKDTAAILALVKAAHPDAQTTSASVAWYRSQMKKGGKPTPKAPAAPLKFKAGKNADGGLTLTPASAPAVYEVRGIKSITGTEGAGYECSLYRDGKKVAVAVDPADGGPVHWYWADAGKTKAEVTAVDYAGETHKYVGSAEEAKFAAFCLAKGTYKSDYTGEDMHYDMDLVVEDLVNDAYLLKQLHAMTKKGTRIAFVSDKNKGALMTCNATPTPENIKRLVYERDGKDAKVLNTLSEAEAVALLKSLQR